ncbi:hypothetical protein [Abyssisolibacter fermentans]|uniref:hypothetical protein n=1 Tax=Abyssisolibacter fermentans TaxID=1766203 RepID=UPI00082A3559|nr:hypothetical protein [Abyssisolibacter fermentans]
MITTNDYSYKDKKLVKQGKKKMDSTLMKLADWIYNKYCVKVLNICYEKVGVAANSQRPRLEIVFEFKEEAEKFRSQENINYDPIKQEEIKCKFIEINNAKKSKVLINFFAKNNKYKYDMIDLFVIFSAFEPIARSDANNRVTREEISELKNKYQDYSLWEISKFFSATTFFFYTDYEVELHKADGLIDDLKMDYLKVLKKYDEFDYINFGNFSIMLDSKENFDKNYDSNWYYYYK